MKAKQPSCFFSSYKWTSVQTDSLSYEVSFNLISPQMLLPQKGLL